MDMNEIRQTLQNDPAVRDMIAKRAFEIFKANGYQLGRDFENWVEAEQQILPGLVNEEVKRRQTEKARIAEAVTESAIAEETIAAPTVEEKPAVEEKPKAKKATKKAAAPAEAKVEAPAVEEKPAKAEKPAKTSKTKK